MLFSFKGGGAEVEQLSENKERGNGERRRWEARAAEGKEKWGSNLPPPAANAFLAYFEPRKRI